MVGKRRAKAEAGRVGKCRATAEEGLEKERLQEKRVRKGRTTGDRGLGNEELLQRDGYEKRLLSLIIADGGLGK